MEITIEKKQRKLNEISFKNTIREVLKAKGYERPRLSKDIYEQLKCTTKEFARWTRNESQPNAEQFVKLSLFFNYPLQDLYTIE